MARFDFKHVLSNKRKLYSYETLKNSRKNLETNKFPIRHSQPHIHQLSLTYFGHFEVYFCSIFRFH